MTLKTALYDELTGDVDISGTVGTRVYPGTVPLLASRPYIVYEILDQVDHHHMGGVTTLKNDRVKITIYAKTAKAVDDLVVHVTDLLAGFRGTMGDENLPIRNCLKRDGIDDYEEPDDGSQKGKHQRRLDFDIWYFSS